MDKIFFIRHKFDHLSAIIESYCIENKCIAIHFNKEFYLDFSDYPQESKTRNFKLAFSHFTTLSKEGGIVVTEYNRNEFYIGEVVVNTQIQPFNYGELINSGNDYYKTLKLNNRKGPFQYSDYPLLSALRPPFMTICKLSDYSRNIILHLYKDVPLPLDVINLHPKMLEQMCEEWLRTDLAKDFKIKFGLLKTGKTLETIDIFARCRNDKDLLVQITHSNSKNKIRSKVSSLKKYFESKSKNRQSIALFFAPKKCSPYIDEDVKFIAIEDVFDQLINVSDYKEMIVSMIGIKQ